MTMAKGITSGYVPLGATMVSDEIADALEAGGYLAHGFTYTGHPVDLRRRRSRTSTSSSARSSSSACATTSVRASRRRCARSRPIPPSAEVRGVGLIGALELRRPRAGPARRRGAEHARRSPPTTSRARKA